MEECLQFKQVEEESNDGLVTPSNGIGKVKLWWIYSLGNHRQLGIGVIRDHLGAVLRAYSKHGEMGLTNEAEKLALLEGLP